MAARPQGTAPDGTISFFLVCPAAEAWNWASSPATGRLSDSQEVTAPPRAFQTFYYLHWTFLTELLRGLEEGLPSTWALGGDSMNDSHRGDGDGVPPTSQTPQASLEVLCAAWTSIDLKHLIAIRSHVLKEYIGYMGKVSQRLLSDKHRGANYHWSRMAELSQGEDRLECNSPKH